MTTTSTKFWAINDIAQWAGVHVATVYRWAQRKDAPPHYRRGRWGARLWLPSDWLSWSLNPEHPDAISSENTPG